MAQLMLQFFTLSNNLMAQSVGIHEVITVLSNALSGDFQSRRLFHNLRKMERLLKAKQTTDPYDL